MSSVKKTWKKYFGWGVFVVIFIATSLGTSLAQAGVTIKVLVSEYPATRAQEQLKHEFERQTGIKVEYTFLPWEGAMNKVKMTAATKDPTYDIMAYDILLAQTLMAAGGFEPLKPYIDDPELPDISLWTFVPGQVDKYGTYKGEVLAVPLWYNNRVYGYRKDLFEDPKERADFKAKYGYPLPYPETWKEFRDVIEFFTRDTDGDGRIDMWGTTKGYMVGPAWDHWNDIYESTPAIEDGKWHVNDAMEPIFNNEKGYRALEYMVDITQSGFVKPGYMEMEWGDIPAAFVVGDVASLGTWTDGLQTVELSPLHGKVHYMPVPRFEEAHVLDGGWMFALNKYSRNKREAYRFLAWVLSPEIEKKTVVGQKEYMGCPARMPNLFDPEVVARQPYIPAVVQSTTFAVPWPLFPEFEEMYDIVSRKIQAALLGEKTAKAALDEAAAEVRKVLEKAGYYD